MKMSKTETKILETMKQNTAWSGVTTYKVSRKCKRDFNAAEKLFLNNHVRLVQYGSKKIGSTVYSSIEIELWSTQVDEVLEEVKAEAMKLKAKFEESKIFARTDLNNERFCWSEMVSESLNNARDTEGADVLGSTSDQLKYWQSFTVTLEMILDQSEAVTEDESERVEVELTFEPRHWNKNAACFIPEAWVAWIQEPGAENLQKWPCGKTKEEAVEAVKREYNNPRFV